MPSPRTSANSLTNEKSPYLLQHANNPVDWYPWGPEALAKAKDEDKPIFLSIGYSACHWCHVMAHESFEDENIARFLNEHFVSIKVDREERPDLDKIYQEAAQITGTQGGWPLSVFLTPDQKPFWVGTYLPPKDRYGRPGFLRLLRGIARTFRDNRDHVEDIARNIAKRLVAHDIPKGVSPPENVLETAASSLAEYVDKKHGGFGGRPKFPTPTALEVLLRAAHRQQNAKEKAEAFEPLDLFLLTLDKMAAGGIYDQLGGGFHRYAVDATWSVPHFEKMLYDNAQLVPLYLAGYQLTGRARYREVVLDTLDYVLREMTGAGGGFYSTQDADSEGEEGKFFVWTRDQVVEALGEEEGRLAAEYLGVTEAGNFEHGTTVLHVATSPGELAAKYGLAPEAAEERLRQAKRRLFELRERRVRPGTDDKVIVSWNGLMIAALAHGGLVLRKPRFVQAAKTAADFIIKNLYNPDSNRLLRVFRDGPASISGYLDDYAYFIRGLLSLYCATWDEKYLELALALAAASVEEFWSESHGDFFYSPDQGENLITRPRDQHDAAVPAAGAVAAHNMILLQGFVTDVRFAELPGRLLETYGGGLVENPFGMASLVAVHDAYVHGPSELTLVTPSPSEPLQLPDQWLKILEQHYVPDLLYTTPSGDRPIWEGKEGIEGETACYVCRDFSCSLPLMDPARVSELLEANRAAGAG